MTLTLQKNCIACKCNLYGFASCFSAAMSKHVMESRQAQKKAFNIELGNINLLSDMNDFPPWIIEREKDNDWYS